MKAAALALLVVTATAQALPPPFLPWVVTGTEVVEGLPLLLTGDVVVEAGGVLSLRGVEATMASGGARPLAILVRAGGLLELRDGVPAQGGPARPTTLAGLGAYTLTVQPGGALVADGARVRDARWSVAGDAGLAGADVNLSEGALVVAGGALSVRQSVLHHSPSDLLVLEAGSAGVEDSLLRDAGTNGIRAQAGSTLEVGFSKIERAGGYGVLVQGATATIEDTVFTGATDYGLRADGGSVTIRRSAFSHHCGAFLGAGATGSVEDSTFAAESHGLTLRNAGTVLVEGNRIEAAAAGLTVLGSGVVTVSRNVFEGNVVGIAVKGASPSIEENAFLANGVGAQVSAGAGGAVSAPLLRDNRFEGSTTYGLQNLQAATVDARWNWWGSPSGPGAPGADAAGGPLDVAPWLPAPP